MSKRSRKDEEGWLISDAKKRGWSAVIRRKDVSDGDGKGWRECGLVRRPTVLRSIDRVGPKESFPRTYIFGELLIAVALGDCLE